MTTETTEMTQAPETSTIRINLTDRHIPRDDIHNVYTGKPGCMCGCNGHYTASKTCPAEFLQDNKVHQPTIGRVAKILESDPRTKWQDGCGQKILFLDTGTRYYAAYVSETADLSAFPESEDN